jgi:hypothetical protein
LERQGFIVKDKKPIKRRGRPVFLYSLPPKISHKISLTFKESQTTIVSLIFQGLRHLCRFEKADTARKLNENAKPKTAPNPKRRMKTIFNQFNNIVAREYLSVPKLISAGCMNYGYIGVSSWN